MGLSLNILDPKSIFLADIETAMEKTAVINNAIPKINHPDISHNQLTFK